MKTIPFILIMFSFQLIGQNKIQSIEKQVIKKSYIPYFLKCYEADSLYFSKNYERSYKILDGLFQEYEPKNSYMIYEYETYVKSSLQIRNFDNINEKISKMIGDYGYEKEFFISDTTDVLYNGYLKAGIDENTYGLLRFNYLSKIDREMRKELYSMDYYARNYGRNVFFEDAKDFEKKEIIENYKELLKNWFDSGIYPSLNVVGNYNVDEFNSHSIFEIINQFDNENFFNKIEPKLKFFLETGECSPFEYAQSIDFREILVHKTSKYLVFFISYSFEDNADYSKYNIERKKIGLPSVEYSLWKMAMWEKLLEEQK